jgi:hypothetical protein
LGFLWKVFVMPKNRKAQAATVSFACPDELRAAIDADASRNFETASSILVKRLSDLYADELPRLPSADANERAVQADLAVKEMRWNILARNVVMKTDAIDIANRVNANVKQEMEVIIADLQDSLPDQAKRIDQLFERAKRRVFFPKLKAKIEEAAANTPPIEKIIKDDPITKATADVDRRWHDLGNVYANDLKEFEDDPEKL